MNPDQEFEFGRIFSDYRSSFFVRELKDNPEHVVVIVPLKRTGNAFEITQERR